MSSFRKINYSLRPAKAVERKMLSFALKKLSHFSDLSTYQYIGFGATTFHDFVLFHKDLGIHKMISMELSNNKQRFNFNKPFHCIDMRWGDSSQILPSIDWKQKTILWLDYDKTLKKSYLDDTATFFSSATSGSTFLITMNCEAAAYGDNNEDRRQKVTEEITEENMFFGNRSIDFSTNNLPKSLLKILNNRIHSTLIARNGGLSEENKLIYEQLFHFHYADGVKMLTVGGIVLNAHDKDRFDTTVNFNEFSFIKKGDEFFNIDIPILTMKEIRFLNSQLPNGVDDEGNIIQAVPNVSNPNLPPTDILKFSKIYSFFPLYTEAFSI